MGVYPSFRVCTQWVCALISMGVYPRRMGVDPRLCLMGVYPQFGFAFAYNRCFESVKVSSLPLLARWILFFFF